MSKIDLGKLVNHLRTTQAWKHKYEIITLSDDVLQHFPVVDGHTVQLGDDTAVIKQDDDYLLFAAEAVHPPLIDDNPYLAGRAAILANVNDIYAMGGKPMAVVDTIISPDIKVASEIIQGLKDGCKRYDVPIVGGHLTATGHKPAVTVCILGRAKNILSSFNAQPDDVLLHVTNLRGSFQSQFQFWNCSSHLSDSELRRDLSIFQRIAENGWCDAARDISMAGVLGTAVMLLELSGVGAQINLNNLIQPENIDDKFIDWLLCFPSYGFVLSVRPWHLSDVKLAFDEHGISCSSIGKVTADYNVKLVREDEEVVLWDFDREPFTGFSLSSDIPIHEFKDEQLNKLLA
ncbi:MAG: sll0787 family AIR synthase-like protein [Candidatus Marinimicrobia bacterium]|nr:sll0787 family AIR synthase-like protein [Candidatus Neomarinimicrobiota bacterium]